MILPAAVTPFDEKGRVDMLGVAKLLAWFESNGCDGVVLAGTNGEGPSLSAVEKRDLVLGAVPLAGALRVVLAIATSSLNEAVWLCNRAGDAGAHSVLLMPPSYFREVGEAAIEAWFRHVLDRSPVPVIVYNFPKRTGITLTPELCHRLTSHEKFAGIKDSSGEPANIAAYREAVSQELFVGDETLLRVAWEAGWTGSISGAANFVPRHLVETWRHRDARFDLLLPVLQAIRSVPQPAVHKAILNRWGVLPRADVRLPLTPVDDAAVDGVERRIREDLGG